jgi:hypothetical protein
MFAAKNFFLATGVGKPTSVEYFVVAGGGGGGTGGYKIYTFTGSGSITF